MLRKITFVSIAASFALSLPTFAFGFESAKVLPKGVRNVNLRSVDTKIDEKSNDQGSRLPLADPLMQSLTFKKIAKSDNDLKENQLKAWLGSNSFNEEDSVGTFTADLKGRVSVFAPIIGYGLTEKLTLAIGVPYYRAQTRLEVGFKPTETAQAFLNELAKPQNNQVSAAREAGDKLNNAVGELNKKLRNNGYRDLKDWEGSGLGDMTLAGKYRWLDAGILGSAATAGLVAPTGRVEDPDILNDMSFGDGQWDVFTQLALDEALGGDFTLNQFAKYTYQAPGRKSMRQVTADEKIEVETQQMDFKLGDKFDAGTSVMYQPAFGLVTGLGYTYYQKFGDRYDTLSADTSSQLQKNTHQRAHNAEAQLGYSTVALYQKGQFPAPFDMKLTYVKQLSSVNMPISDLAQFDMNLFF